MNVTLPINKSGKDSSVFDDCLIGSFLKNLFSRIHGTKGLFDYKVTTQAKNIQADLATLNEDSGNKLTYEYLQAMERSLPDASFRYVVIHKNNKPVLLGYFQLYTLTAQNFNLDENKGIAKGVLRFFLTLKKAKVLISGNALRNEEPAFIYDKNEFTPEVAIEGFVSAAEKIAADECPMGMILRGIPLSLQLIEKGYQAPASDEVMNMAIDPNWASLPDYMNDLSRKYKARAVKTIEALNGLTIRHLGEKEVVHYQAEMNQLFNEVTQQQSFVLTRPAENYLSSLKKLYKDNFEVVGFFEGEKLLAFYSAFVTEGAYEMYYVGFNYTANNQYQLYFNMLFSGLERAIVLRKQTLKLGRTSFDAKASLGAKAESLDYSIKMVHLTDFVLRRIVSYFSSLEDKRWKQRNPLKTAQHITGAS